MLQNSAASNNDALFRVLVDGVQDYAIFMLDLDGKIVNWRFELGAPNALIRLGWKTDTVKAGTEVEITGFRAKAGGPVGNGRSIKLADGRELFSGGSAPAADR